MGKINKKLCNICFRYNNRRSEYCEDQNCGSKLSPVLILVDENLYYVPEDEREIEENNTLTNKEPKITICDFCSNELKENEFVCPSCNNINEKSDLNDEIIREETVIKKNSGNIYELSKDNVVIRIIFHDEENIIGREDMKDLSNDYVSRKHLIYYRNKNGKNVIKDISTNGTSLDNIRMVYNQEYDIDKYNNIIFANIKFTIKNVS